MEKMKLLHISHFDLDGVTPLVVTKLFCDMSQKYDLAVMEISPTKLLDTLKYIASDEYEAKPDIILITDLNCQKPVLEFLWKSGLMRITCVMDHHQTAYDPIEFSMSPEIMSVRERFGKEYMEIDPKDHIFIMTNIPVDDMANAKLIEADKFRQTCGTKIYLDLILNEFFDDIFNYATSANAIAVKNVENEEIRYIDAEKLQYISNCVRMYDTFDFMDYLNDPDEFTATDALRLNTLFNNIERDAYYGYIMSYLTIVDVTWGQLTFDNALFPAGTIIDPILKRDARYAESKAKQVVKMMWHPKVINPVTKKLVDYGRPVMTGIVLLDRVAYGMVAAKILEQNQDIEMIAVPLYDNIGLYTRKHNATVNVGDIAMMFGGGGHASAAGFPVSEDNAQWMIRNYFTGLTNLSSGIAKVTVTTNEDGTKNIEERYGE